jgi:type IX secretion system PorP/SprF family membrane protein
MKRKFIVAIFVLFFTFSSKAQDPNFTLFYNNPTYYNPAMTAMNNGLTFRSNDRMQWSKIPGRFNTFSASFEGKFRDDIGTGIVLFSDVAGEGFLRTTGVTVTNAYSISNANNKFQVGMSSGFMNRYIDWNKFSFSDQYDEVLGKVHPTNFVSPNYNSTFHLDLGFGAAYQFYYDSKTTKQFKKILVNVGGAMQHLNRPRDAFFNDKNVYPLKTVIHARTQILFGVLLYSFAGIYETQNKFSTRTLGFSMQNKNGVNVGLWSRSGNTINNQRLESLIASIGIIIPSKSTYKIRLTYSADFTISALRIYSFGSNEISLVFMISDKYILNGLKAKRQRKEMFKCPEYFN